MRATIEVEVINMRGDTQQNISSLVSFEKDRLEYCENAYAIEKERRQIIEKRAQIYLGIIVMLLGLMATRGGPLFARPDYDIQHWGIALLISDVLAAGCIAAAIYAISRILWPFRRAKPFSEKMICRLPKIPSANNIPKIHSDFLYENAILYSTATEANSIANTKDAKWLMVAARSIIVFTLFEGVSIILLVTKGG
jgi:hypothetical protein